MAILKFEIDTDDIFRDYDGDGASFESLVHGAIKQEIKKEVLDKISAEEKAAISDEIINEVRSQVSISIQDLINEDIVIQDRWGKKQFIGSVEDYIKKEIDESFLHGVDSNGKKLNGCTTAPEQNWVQWHLRSLMKHEIDSMRNKAVSAFKKTLEAELNGIMESFKKTTIRDEVMARLEAVGITQQ